MLVLVVYTHIQTPANSEAGWFLAKLAFQQSLGVLPLGDAMQGVLPESSGGSRDGERGEGRILGQTYQAWVLPF